MNINPEYQSNNEMYANDIMAEGMGVISDLLIEPAMKNGNLDKEAQSILGLVGMSFKIIAEKATEYEKMQEGEIHDQFTKDKTIGFYRN